jgi:hypothetical protein
MLLLAICPNIHLHKAIRAVLIVGLMFTLKDAIAMHAFAPLKALPCV